MRKTVVSIGCMLLLGVVAPQALAHWVTPGRPHQGDVSGGSTAGVAGFVAAPGGVAVSDPPGNVVDAAAITLCDLEIGDLTGGNSAANEEHVEGGATNGGASGGAVPDHTWDDGGIGGACHITSYTKSMFNTDSCGENTAPDHQMAFAHTSVLPAFLIASCDIGQRRASQPNPLGALNVPPCLVNEVLSGDIGFIHCLDPLTAPGVGWANCYPDGTADASNLGYADEDRGVPVPTKSDADNNVGSSWGCSSTEGSTVIFVMAHVGLTGAPDDQPTVSGTAHHVWTEGSENGPSPRQLTIPDSTGGCCQLPPAGLEQDIPAQEAPPVATPPTCEVGPCDDSTTVVPGIDETPGYTVPEQCVPLGVFCAGPIPVESVPVGSPPVTAPPVCDTASAACLGSIEIFPGGPVTPPVVLGAELVEASASAHDIGDLNSLGPITLTVPPTPVTGEFPLTLCQTPCPVPTGTDPDVHLALKVTVQVGDDAYGDTVRFDWD